VTDPVSWLQIEKGWNVVSADGLLVGKVVEVTGDEHDDIFDGLAVKSEESAHVRYVPGEQVAALFPGKVTLKITSAEADTLKPFSEPAPQTKILPQRHRSGLASRAGCKESARRSLPTSRSGHNVWRREIHKPARVGTHVVIKRVRARGRAFAP
jgi:hypothetical protein